LTRVGKLTLPQAGELFAQVAAVIRASDPVDVSVKCTRCQSGTGYCFGWLCH